MIKIEDTSKPKYMIAMSGGVDSTVAAYLALEKGPCIAATMELLENSDALISRAKSVAEKLGIPFYVLDIREEFKNSVVDTFVNSYLKGYTPNPCVTCNKLIKFGALIDEMEKLGAETLVTGHYANIEFDEDSGRYLLKTATDRSKDQTYFLYGLTQNQLSKTYFPLGNLTKKQVREIAAEQGFKNAEDKESQDICFISKGKYGDFIEEYVEDKSQNGNFIDLDGNVLGEHKGLFRYTTGQRRGLGLALKEPMYVHSKDIETNTVTLCRDEDLFTSSFTVSGINLIPFDTLEKPMEANVKTRYSQAAKPAIIEQVTTDELIINFKEPQRAITIGQAAVIYSDDIIVGGGTIQRLEKTDGK